MAKKTFCIALFLVIAAAGALIANDSGSRLGVAWEYNSQQSNTVITNSNNCNIGVSYRDGNGQLHILRLSPYESRTIQGKINVLTIRKTCSCMRPRRG
jgi:hypothetical protein